jgi:hypothetical protein
MFYQAVTGTHNHTSESTDCPSSQACTEKGKSYFQFCELYNERAMTTHALFRTADGTLHLASFIGESSAFSEAPNRFKCPFVCNGFIPFLKMFPGSFDLQ